MRIWGKMKTAYWCIPLGLLALLSGCGLKAEESVVLQGKTMGTTYTVKYISDGTEKEKDAGRLKAEIDAVLVEVNRQMSTYQKDSEISRFNQIRTTGEKMLISSDFATVVNEAGRLNRLTLGALDVTVGPLVNLWGFGPDKPQSLEPSDEEINRVAEAVGMDKIVLENENGGSVLSKTNPNAYLDLSSIAKGFGVDKVAETLDKEGIQNYLVEIGGELRTKGLNERKQPWRVGIEQPNLVQGSATQIVLPLRNRSLATSGDYRIFHVNKEGKRLSHIIHPQTRKPITHNLASVSVIADKAVTADGLATGLFVLGEQAAMELAQKQHLAVFLIVREADGYRTLMSDEFKKQLEEQEK